MAGFISGTMGALGGVLGGITGGVTGDARRLMFGLDPEERRDKLRADISTALLNPRPGQEAIVTLVSGGRTIARPAINVEAILNAEAVGDTQTTGSDVDTLDAIMNDTFQAQVQFVDIVNGQENRGEFFRNVIADEAVEGLRRCGIDLTPYQLYSSEQLDRAMRTNAPEFERHCLWNVLIQTLPDQGHEALLNLPMEQLCTGAVKKRVLQRVATLYKINIRLADMRPSRHSTIYSGRDGSEVDIQIGLYKGHYFHNEDLTTLNNADLASVIRQRALGTEYQEKIQQGSKYFRRDIKTRGVPKYSVLTILRKLDEHGYIHEISPEQIEGLGLARTLGGLKPGVVFYDELYIPTPKDLPANKVKTPRAPKYTDVWYLDFETCTGPDGIQIAYMGCAAKRDTGEMLTSICPRNIKAIGTDGHDPELVGRELLRKICAVSTGHNILCYAHNLRFDANFLHSLSGLDTIEGGGRLYQLTGRHMHRGQPYTFTLHDSWAFVTTPLAKFPSMFDKVEGGKLPDFPYDLFEASRLEDLVFPTSQFTRKQLKLIPDEYVRGGRVHMYEYAAYYCKQDCLVLQQGFDQFREATMQIDLDVDAHMTSAAIAKAYMHAKGCLEGVEPLTGAVRAYVQEAVVGGRVCTRNNEVHDYESTRPEDNLVDFDAVSLYPSAMESIPGFPLGPPTRFEGPPPNMDEYHVATVRITKVGIPLNFSTLCQRDEEGSRVWGKDAVNVGDVHILTYRQIESAREHQDIEFEYIGGLTWAGGWNDTIVTEIQRLFQWRLDLKKANNPLQMTVKLIMNSAYGKLVERPHDDKVMWIRGTMTHAWNKASNKGAGLIEMSCGGIVTPGKAQLWKLRYKSPDFNHKNYAHCGALVLAQSKAIMYKVTTPLDDKILYTDTDSIILPASALKVLQRPDLVGNKMGQFHTDLSWTSKEKVSGEVTGVRGIFLAKKTYVLELVNSGRPDELQYHARMKGIPSKCVELHAKEEGVSTYALYQKVRQHGYIFDLLIGRPRFKQHATSIVKVDAFKRQVGPYCAQ